MGLIIYIYTAAQRNKHPTIKNLWNTLVKTKGQAYSRHSINAAVMLLVQA